MPGVDEALGDVVGMPLMMLRSGPSSELIVLSVQMAPAAKRCTASAASGFPLRMAGTAVVRSMSKAGLDS